MTRKYSTIFFDLDGTLFDYETAARNALIAALRKEGIEGDGTSMYADYRNINLMLWHRFETGDIDPESLKVERFRILIEQRKWENITPEELSVRYLSELSRRSNYLPGAKELLERLQPHFRLLIITNGLASVQHSRFRHAGLEKWIDHMIISEECGVAKPDPRIFTMALKKVSAHPSEVLFVGDSITSDMVGAERSGIDFCWYNPGDQPAPPASRFLFQIRTLDELTGILQIS